MSEASKAVFLSYASQDAAAALRLSSGLRTAGVEVWFDQSELVGGDAWDAKIRKQIAECALFVPVISANTQARGEGYFRLEWKLAVDRSHLMAHDQPFLLPIVIDSTADAAARVPPEFRAVQWTRLPGGETPEAFCTRVRNLLGGATEGSTVEGSFSPDSRIRTVRPEREPPPTARSRARWLFPATLGALTVGALALWRPWSQPAAQPSRAAVGPANAEKAAAPLTEARKLTLQARALIDDDPLAVRQNFVLAEELCEKAVALDVSDGEAWATYARVSLGFWDWGYDDTPRRRELARSQSQRAIRLAPDSIEAGLAEAGLAYLSRPPTKAGDEPEPRLRALLRLAPSDRRIYRLLAKTLGRTGQFEAASALRLESDALPGGDPQALSDDTSPFIGSIHNPWEADRMLDRVFAAVPTKTAYHARLGVFVHRMGNLEAARAFLATIPDQLMTEDLFAAQAFILWHRLGEPERALAAIERIPRDFLEERRQKYPRGTLEGLAHHLAGRDAAAKVKWTEALRLVDQRLASESNQPVWIFNKALLLAFLGQKEMAREQLDAFRQLGGSAEFLGPDGMPFVLLLLGEAEAAIGEFQRQMASRRGVSRLLVPNALRFDPLLKSIRDDPRVQALIKEQLGMLEELRLAATVNPPPTTAPAKSAPAQSSAGPAKAAEKSIAVLPFANLSGDKEQEYFSDGLTEEVLGALRRERDLTVPGNTSCFSFKGKNVSGVEIARALNVARLVEGSVQRVGSRVRIRVALSRPADNSSEEIGTFTEELTDIFALQEKVARAVVAKLTRRTSTAPVAVLTRNPAAYDAYLRGRALKARGLASFPEAIKLLEKATTLDPAFAQAWASLAEAKNLHALGRDESPELVAETRDLIDRALTLQPNLPEALIARAYWERRFKSDYAAAQRDLARAEALQPATAELRYGQAFVARDLGQWDEAFRFSREMVQLDPNNAQYLQGVATQIFWRRGDYAGADRLLARVEVIQEGYSDYRVVLRLIWRGPAAALQLLDRVTPNSKKAKTRRIELLLAMNRPQEARALAAETESDLVADPTDPLVGYRAGLVFSRLGLGREDAARRLAAEMSASALNELNRGNRASQVRIRFIRAEIVLGHRERAMDALEEWRRENQLLPNDFVRRFFGSFQANLYALLGRADEAIALLSEFSAGGLHSTYSLRYDDDFAAIRSDPRFQKLMQQQEAWAQAQPDPLDP